MYLLKIILLVFCCCFFSFAIAQNSGSKTLPASINWPQFLGRSNMLWKDKLPGSWNNGIFLGNGCLGTMFWVHESGALHFEINRSDLYDHRNDAGGSNTLFSNNRLPNGHFELGLGTRKPTGNIQLDLWNATATGSIEVGNNKYVLKCYTAADRNLIVIEVVGDTTQQLKWVPDSAKSTRRNPPKNYHAYPVQIAQQRAGIMVSIQQMPVDSLYNTQGKQPGQYATAWLKKRLGNKTVYFISMGFSYPGITAADEAVNIIKRANKDGLQKIENAHKAWWHNYYPKSFLSVPDAAMESFYWIQLYKMGSASRQGGPVLDLMGPWFAPTNWPAIWWNLNIQLSYWPFYISNHVDAVAPLAKTVWDARKALAKNAAPYQDGSYAIGRASSPQGYSPVGKEVGNLPWTMHNLWMYYRSTMDDKYLKEQLFPLMKGTFNFLMHIVVKNPDGKWSLPKTASPEYTDSVENCSYTMACFRWLANTIILADERLKLNDAISLQCKEVLNKLVPYEVDKPTGFMVGKNMPFAMSHRHWSHLFMIYPFQEYTWENPLQAPLVAQSVKNWLSMPQAFAGYSWLGAASILEAGGKGDEALGYLQSFLKKAPLDNTFYREGSPVIETPLAFARTLQEMMMMSNGNVINIFPAVPSIWKDVAFADFRAEGAFLISAKRVAGKTVFIQIKSLSGEICKIKTNIEEPAKVAGINKLLVKNIGNGITEIGMKKGGVVTLYWGNKLPSIQVQPVRFLEARAAWGGQKPY